MTRELTVTINMDEDKTEVTVKDNETMITNTFDYYGSCDEHPEFDAWIGTEIASWIGIMAEEFEE